MSLFAYVLTRIRVFFDAFTRFAYARFLRIFWFAYLRAALYMENRIANINAKKQKLTVFAIEPTQTVCDCLQRCYMYMERGHVLV